MIGIDNFHDPAVVAALLQRIELLADRVERPVTFMEVCGSHTHAIAESGLRRRLPETVRLISGPGCPVCVTPVDYLDAAWALATQRNAILATFGDLMRVPSSTGSLEQLRAAGTRVQIVYSPRDAVNLARDNPDRTVVFLAVGFETTAPTIAAALEEAETTGIENFMILPGNKIMPPPLRALAGAEDVRVDGFLLPGHVSVITGSDAFNFLSDEYRIPGAVVGFTPADVLRGVLGMLESIKEETPRVANFYGRVVTPSGNTRARDLVDRFFEPETSNWRGLGAIPLSGLGLRPKWTYRDAGRLPVDLPQPVEPPGCRCGEVLKGTIQPSDCPLFATGCTPERPVGACMVSSEGSCAAWFRHERWAVEADS